MRALLLATSLLAVSPALAQHTNPYQGPMPNTVMLDHNWQMTPGDDDCTLVHRNALGTPDLVLASRRDQQHSVVGIILPRGAPYAAALQLSVFAQTDSSQQIGRVTFTPHHDALATLLMASWPTTNLLPRLRTASRLDFYAANSRLVTSVSTVGGEAAVASYSRCLSSAADKSVEWHVSPAAATQWRLQADRSGCSIIQRSEEGDMINLEFDLDAALVMLVRTPNQKHGVHALKTDVTFILMQRADRNSYATATSDVVHASGTVTQLGGADALLVTVAPTLVSALSDPAWNALAVSTSPKDRWDINETVSTAGIGGAITALKRCNLGLGK